MHRAVIEACLPWLAALAGSLVATILVCRASGARWNLARLRQAHADQQGGVQSLSFVLALPLFLMLALFVLQISQLLLGTIVVHYAAFAAARSAIVWIPANAGTGQEQENRISQFAYLGTQPGGEMYRINPGSPKFQQIEFAAALACAGISPSNGPPSGIAAGQTSIMTVVQRLYQSLDPNAASNSRIPRRLANKLAYSRASTRVEVTFLHKMDEPPLARYGQRRDVNEFYPNEVGWQDPITVTVTHQFALLPGPGRLLARWARIAGGTTAHGSAYQYPIFASATLGNEGEKSVAPFIHALNSVPPRSGTSLQPYVESP